MLRLLTPRYLAKWLWEPLRHSYVALATCVGSVELKSDILFCRRFRQQARVIRHEENDLEGRQERPIALIVDVQAGLANGCHVDLREHVVKMVDARFVFKV